MQIFNVFSKLYCINIENVMNFWYWIYFSKFHDFYDFKTSRNTSDSKSLSTLKIQSCTKKIFLIKYNKKYQWLFFYES